MPSGITAFWPKWARASGVPSSARLPKPAAIDVEAPPLTFRPSKNRDTKAATIQVMASPPKKATHRPQGEPLCGSMAATVLNSSAGMATLKTKSVMPLPAAALKTPTRVKP